MLKTRKFSLPVEKLKYFLCILQMYTTFNFEISFSLFFNCQIFVLSYLY